MARESATALPVGAMPAVRFRSTKQKTIKLHEQERPEEPHGSSFSSYLANLPLFAHFIHLRMALW